MFSTEMITTSISISSLVCVYDEFPRGHGNYISVWDDKTKVGYSVVNLSCEDLEDAIKLGIIGDTMKAEVYGEGNNRVAYIIDERLPVKCLTPLWWYGGRSQFRVPILRRKFNMEDGVCLCKNTDNFSEIITWTRFLKNDRIGNCPECGTECAIGDPKNLEKIVDSEIVYQYNTATPNKSIFYYKDKDE